MARPLAWAREMLRRRPLLTNTCIYASFYSAAELSQQTFNKIYAPEKPDYDLVSAARIVTVGTTVYAPTLFFWYKLLDGKFVGTSVKVVATKVLLDQGFMTPTLLACFYTILGYLENKETVEEIKQKYIKTLIANQMFWLPGQTINFFLIPPYLRIVYVSATSFVWINILCFIKRQTAEKT